MSPVAHPVGAGVPDGPHRRTFEYRRTFVYPSVGAGVPDGPFSVLRLRAAPASCMYASGGHISFNSERNMEKNAAKNQRFLDFPCPIPTTVQKGSASNRLYPHPRCRSHAPRGDAPVCYRAAGLLRPYRRFPEYRRTQIDAPRRGRRPDGPLMFPPCPQRGEFRAAQARSPHPGKKGGPPAGWSSFLRLLPPRGVLTPS